jgi:hypothetical protein
MSFSAEVADDDKEKEFEGALPTTIYQVGFSEVYGKNPDIDSTALMISITSWILGNWSLRHGHSYSIKDSSQEKVVASQDSADYVSGLLAKIGASPARSAPPLRVTARNTTSVAAASPTANTSFELVIAQSSTRSILDIVHS